MTDIEIIKWFKSIKPKNEKQRKALESAERAFYKALNFCVDDELDEFLSVYERTDLINKPSGELYDEYLEYCNDFDADEISHSAFSKYVMYKFNLKIKVSKVNDKSVRVYK